MTVHERIEYINARGKLLQFFLIHMYSYNTELFNSKNYTFLNDMGRMKYFIDRFNQYYDEETYDFMVYHPSDADEHHESHNPDAVDSSYIHEILMAIRFIKEYFGLQAKKKTRIISTFFYAMTS